MARKKKQDAPPKSPTYNDHPGSALGDHAVFAAELRRLRRVLPAYRALLRMTLSMENEAYVDEAVDATSATSGVNLDASVMRWALSRQHRVESKDTDKDDLELLKEEAATFVEEGGEPMPHCADQWPWEKDKRR